MIHIRSWPCGHAITKDWPEGPCPICAEIVAIGAELGAIRAAAIELSGLIMWNELDNEDIERGEKLAAYVRGERADVEDPRQEAIDRLGDFLGLASHDLESAYRSMRSDLIRCFVKAKAAR